MDALTFREQHVAPTLKHIGMWSKAAETLLMMTAAHESMGFRYREQIGGPALSFFQVEPDTLNDLYKNYLAFRPARQLACDQFMKGDDRLFNLKRNDDYACAVARMIYARVPEPLPDAEDLEGLAKYAKTYWNTELGAATPEKYLEDYRRYCE